MSEQGGRSPRVAIIGRQNVGKSTLVNRLFGRRETIAHGMPGVTRDRIELEVSWRGRRFGLVDTAGLRLTGARGIRQPAPSKPNVLGHRRPIWCCWSSCPGPGIRRKTRRSRAGCAASRCRCCWSRTRWTPRRRSRRPPPSTAWAWATRSRSPDCTGAPPEICWTASSRCFPTRPRRRTSHRRSRASPSWAVPTWGSRASSTGWWGRSAPWCSRRRARRAMPWTPSWSGPAGRCDSSTPRGCGDRRACTGSSTSASCAPRKPSSARTSRCS